MLEYGYSGELFDCGWRYVHAFLMGVYVRADDAAIAAAVDAYLAIYPAVIIWRLHMSIKKKLALSLALGLGAWYVPFPLLCMLY